VDFIRITLDKTNDIGIFTVERFEGLINLPSGDEYDRLGFTDCVVREGSCYEAMVIRNSAMMVLKNRWSFVEGSLSCIPHIREVVVTRTAFTFCDDRMDVAMDDSGNLVTAEQALSDMVLAILRDNEKFDRPITPTDVASVLSVRTGENWGSIHVEPILTDLDKKGLITYNPYTRLTRFRTDEMVAPYDRREAIFTVLKGIQGGKLDGVGLAVHIYRQFSKSVGQDALRETLLRMTKEGIVEEREGMYQLCGFPESRKNDIDGCIKVTMARCTCFTTGHLKSVIEAGEVKYLSHDEGCRAKCFLESCSYPAYRIDHDGEEGEKPICHAHG
jgi:hypothetical protein